MKLIGREILDTFSKRHANCLKPLRSWVKIVEAANWRKFQDVKNQFRSADVLSGNRVIFDIKGNNYRLVTVVAYRQDVVQVLWIGTHAEYSKKTGIKQLFPHQTSSMNIFPIRTKADHQRALARVSALMQLDPASGTPESDELEVLSQIIEIYEKSRFNLGNPHPIDLIAFAMEQRGLTQKDMVAFLGSPSRVSEVLAGKRPLTLQMIRKLHLGLGLPVEALVVGGMKKQRGPFKPAAKHMISSSVRGFKTALSAKRIQTKARTA